VAILGPVSGSKQRKNDSNIADLIIELWLDGGTKSTIRQRSARRCVIGDVINVGAGLGITTPATNHVVIDALRTSISLCPTADC